MLIAFLFLGIAIPQAYYDSIRDALRKDVGLLNKMKIMDYSLLLGVFDNVSSQNGFVPGKLD